MGKLITVILLLVTVLVALGFSIGFLYNELPREPVELISDIEDSEPIQIINYGATPVFAENLRFNHNNISFFIEKSCSNVRSTSMKEAFKIFHDKMEIISFYEIENDSADILVGCSNEIVVR